MVIEHSHSPGRRTSRRPAQLEKLSGQAPFETRQAGRIELDAIPLWPGIRSGITLINGYLDITASKTVRKRQSAQPGPDDDYPKIHSTLPSFDYEESTGSQGDSRHVCAVPKHHSGTIFRASYSV